MNENPKPEPIDEPEADHELEPGLPDIETPDYPQADEGDKGSA